MRTWRGGTTGNKKNAFYNDEDLEYDVSYDPVPNPFQVVNNSVNYAEEEEEDDVEMNRRGSLIGTRPDGKVYLAIICFLLVILAVSFSSSNNKTVVTGVNITGVDANQLNNEILQPKEIVTDTIGEYEHNNETTDAKESEPCPATVAAAKATSSSLHYYDPFEEEPMWYGSIFAIPPASYYSDLSSKQNSKKQPQLGYLQHPNVRNGTLVFCTEGDLYISYISQRNSWNMNNERKAKASSKTKKNQQPTLLSTNQPTSSPTIEEEKENSDNDDADNINGKLTSKPKAQHAKKVTSSPTTKPTSAPTTSAVSELLTEDIEDIAEDDGDDPETKQIGSTPTTKPTIDPEETEEDYEDTYPAMKLTETIGNVLSPIISPMGDLVAFTATYTGSRQVYILNLHPNKRYSSVLRVSYLETSVEKIVGWSADSTALYIISKSLEVSMPHSRLYKLYIKRPEASSSSSRTLEVLNDDNMEELKDESDDDTTTKNVLSSSFTTSDAFASIGEIQPIPLSSVVDATIDSNTNCIYFVKSKQSSQTVRYVGGTTENIWKWCENDSLAVNLTSFYKGTTKSPQIWNQTHLFFLSDFQESGPTTMNLFAIPLKNTPSSLTTSEPQKFIQLTSVSCRHYGMPLSEYAIDPIRGDVVLRIGADFEILRAQEISAILSSSSASNQVQQSDKEELTVALKTTPTNTHPLHIAVYSDFNLQQERRFPAIIPEDITSLDVFTTSFKQTKVLLGLRGQAWVAPVISDTSPESSKKFAGGTAQNLPLRRYRVIPGATVGGIVRVLAAKYIPANNIGSNNTALILATDPLSPTAELAFYVVDCGASAAPSFLSADELPKPILGGHLNGGPTIAGGLGSIYAETLEVSPCGRRAAWVDTDGRIMAMTIPNITTASSSSEQQPTHVKLVKLKRANNRNQPIVGMCSLNWSPAGRYIAISHSAANQFEIISIADLGDPSKGKIIRGNVVQATPDRFNSKSPVWGRTSFDFKLDSPSAAADHAGQREATMLYFLSDRDISLTDVDSPWGTRAPSPYFPEKCSVYAIPLQIPETGSFGTFVGGGAAELLSELDAESNLLFDASVNVSNPKDSETDTPILVSSSQNTTSLEWNKKSNDTSSARNPMDLEINFGSSGKISEFARRAYRVIGIPSGNYRAIICQLNDDPSFILVEKQGDDSIVKIFGVDDFPGDMINEINFDTHKELQSYGTSTSKQFVYLSLGGKLKIVPNTAAGAAELATDTDVLKNIADTDDLALSIMPHLEYEQMYGDAWRMMRDYFYDPELHQVDWLAVYDRYKPLVARCSKREELDNVLELMSSELSALHVFVYGGEYADPLHGSPSLKRINDVSSLGAFLKRSTEHNGYIILSIHEGDPDFDLVDGLYSPLSERTLAISGQKGLKPGDVILGINGESVLSVPDINYLLRGVGGRSLRLDVLRSGSDDTEEMQDAVIVVPISTEAAADLRYSAWEWETREDARRLATEKGFTVGYIHLRDMGTSAMDAFMRGFFPDYNKDAFIIDVRHNLGGNIDSWLLDVLQRQAWTFWESRATNITTGGEGWDEMFAFRGHLVVLIDEGTSSDGEGFSRGISELKLGKLIGKRTWGGGIWLASDNHLVDGGIATAPEIGTYNNNFGWGMGIEQMGVEPDIEVENNPRTFYDGKDDQLQEAIEVLAQWLKVEPVVLPKRPGPHPNMALKTSAEDCEAKY